MVVGAHLPLGPSASAALPVLYRALAHVDWSKADLSRALRLSPAQITRLMSGQQGPSLATALDIHRLFAAVRPVLWTKPCPANWKPHDYPDLRRRARARSVDQGTGTDGK